MSYKISSIGNDTNKFKTVMTVGSNAAGSNIVTFASDVNISSGNVINMNGSRIRSGAGGIIEFDLPTYDSNNNLHMVPLILVLQTLLLGISI